MPELSTSTPPAPSKDKPAAGTSLETARSVARRLDVSTRTLHRYIAAGILPEPVRIRGKRFWLAGVMPKIDT
jgi:MerR family regulatory protein